jgi:hypothetical protein
MSQTPDEADPLLIENEFWHRAFFAGRRSSANRARRRQDLTRPPEHKTVEVAAEYWMKCLFEGALPDKNPGDKLSVFREGVVIHEIPLDRLGAETIIGRHPSADLQLESHRLGMYHLTLLKKGGRLYVQGLDPVGTLLDRKKLTMGIPVPLWDGAQVCKRLRKNGPLKRPGGPVVAVPKWTALKSSRGSEVMTALGREDARGGCIAWSCTKAFDGLVTSRG